MRNRGTMNNLPIISSYEIKLSRTEHKVPVVNGVHLHSIYNPLKEAENLVDANIEILNDKNEVLILGLGFGYHVNYIIERLTKIHEKNFKIIVIEPNNQVHQDCLLLELLNKKNVLVYSGFSAHELYSDIDLIHFLLNKPAVIAHPASFNLYQLYFKKFLTFEAPVKLNEIINFTEDPEVKKYLNKFDTSLTFDEAFYNQLPKKSQFESMDFLAMALAEMTQKNIVQAPGDAE